MIEVYKIFSGKYDATVTNWKVVISEAIDLVYISLRYIMILGNTIL